MKTDEAQPAPTPETDEILEYLRVQFPATDGHIPLREKIEKLERECDKKDAQIKRLCEDWADDDTRIKAIAKTHGIEVESLSVEDGYFHTCVDVAEKMSEALTAKDAQIVALREDVRPLLEALKECDGIASDNTIAIGKEHDLYGPFSDIWDAASHALKDFTAKHPLP
jgi:hypothetical protein